MGTRAAQIETNRVGSQGRVAPIPGYFQTTNEGAPGPSLSGTGGATVLNPFATLPVNPRKSASRKRSRQGL